MRLWRSLRDRLVLELGDPTQYTEPEEKIAERLLTDDSVLSAELVDEAAEIAGRQQEDAESIGRRAATLQGAVALATTLTLAGGALILDAERVPSRCWRLALASVLTVAVFSFVAAGVRALGASSRTHPWSYPGYDDIFDHAQTDLGPARAARAAAMLKAAGFNLRIVQLKGGYLNAAVFWFRIALLTLLGLAVLTVIYAALAS
jgi:hypothetical protein